MRFFCIALALLVAGTATGQDFEGVRAMGHHFDTGPGTVEIGGYWYHAFVDSTLTDYPQINVIPQLNAVEVKCYESGMFCNETIAALTSNVDVIPLGAAPMAGLLVPINFMYSITEWSDERILATSRKRAGNVTIEILLVEGRAVRWTHEAGDLDEGADSKMIHMWVMR